MEDPVLLVLQRASETFGPDLSPFRAIWEQWEAQGNPPGDRWIYLRAETALKQALTELGETNVVEFARSRDLERYTAALHEAIRRIERGGP
jgi:nucleoid-associated protein YgaU